MVAKTIGRVSCLLLFASMAFGKGPGFAVPEIDGSSAAQAVTLIFGSGFLYRFRRNR